MRDDKTVELDTGSKSLGLEDYLKTEKVERFERHKAGEKCLHWRRLPNGAIGYMDEAVARRAPCRWCMGLGTLLGNIEIEKKARSGAWVSAEDFKSFEYERRTVRPRRVA